MTDIPQEFEAWYGNLKKYNASFPARGTISGALVVLERLKTNWNLDIDQHTSSGGSQIQGAGGARIQQILHQFGETRAFVAEGGRTNRGLRGDIKGLLDAVRSSKIQELDLEARAEIITKMQQFLVQRVIEYHNRQHIRFLYNPMNSTWENIHALFFDQKKSGKFGAVAQYLVGAKLALRFPDLEIGNESFSTADVQLGRLGDFLLGNTVFHVTVAPMPPVFEKCLKNIQTGFRPFLLVPHDLMLGTKQLAEQTAQGQIVVDSLETFISQNLEELSYFSSDKVKTGLRNLLEMYNRRVDNADNDKSLLIDLPSNLY